MGAHISAAAEHGLETLEWLHQINGSLAQAIYYGRTPLMEAALWGRQNIAEYLMNQNVELEARDGNGMSAMDLAADTDRNKLERLRRSQPTDREPYNAWWERQQIQALLWRSAPNQRTKPRKAAIAKRNVIFTKGFFTDVILYQERERFGDASLTGRKTFAVLDQGPGYPYIYAMSGYSHSGKPKVLDKSQWTDRAQTLRTHLGLASEKSFASHAEQQLLAYLAYRHSPLGVSREDHQRLEVALPRHSLRATITINKPKCCGECDDLLTRFRKEFSSLVVTVHFTKMLEESL